MADAKSPEDRAERLMITMLPEERRRLDRALREYSGYAHRSTWITAVMMRECDKLERGAVYGTAPVDGRK